MNRRVMGLASVGIGWILSASIAAGQSSTSAPPAANGHPDLQGSWYFGTATPLERPRELADKAFLTAEEAAAFERRAADRIGQTVTVHPPAWLDYGTNVVPDRRTSLIIDPQDGRVPPLKPDAKQKTDARRDLERRGTADGPEDRMIQERCLVFGAGPPLLPGPYNNNIQIVQTADTVMVFSEMIHDARIVPVDGRAQLPPQVKRWLGSSRGHWEGETLVIETTNFTGQTSFRGSDEHLKVVERLHLDSPDALRYQYTIDDPTAFERPWTAGFTMTRTDAQMFEFACHEGNYGLMNIMKAARAHDRDPVATHP